MPSTRLFRNPYRRAFWICASLTAILIATAVSIALYLTHHEIAEKNPREMLILAAFFSGAASLGLLFGAVFVGLMTWKVQRFIACLQRREELVHWSYTPQEWQAFQTAEAPLLARDFRRIVLVPVFLALPLAGVTMLFLFSEEDWKRGDPLWVFAITVGFLGLMTAAAYYFRVLRPRAQGRKKQLSPPDSFIHLDFAYADDQFLFFGAFGQQLIDVQLLPGTPDIVEFTIRGYAPRAGEMLETRRILVPTGQSERAAEVVTSLRQAWRLVATNDVADA